MISSTVNFERIVIYGASGSGKTTLAKSLGEILSIDFIHLDDLFWFPDWQIPTKEAFREIVKKELYRKSWIIDGNYSKVRDLILPQATFAIILDLPLYISIWRIIARTLSRNTKFTFHQSTHLPKRIEESGSKERPLYAIYELSSFSIRYKLHKTKGIIEETKQLLGTGNYQIFKNPKDVQVFIEKIRKMKTQEKS